MAYRSKEAHNAYQRGRYRSLRERGLCVRCRQPCRAVHCHQCTQNTETRRAQNRAYYMRVREQVLAKYQALIAAHICPYCRRPLPEGRDGKRCSECADIANVKNSERYHRRKAAAEIAKAAATHAVHHEHEQRNDDGPPELPRADQRDLPRDD